MKKMKLFVFAILIMMTVFSLSACGRSNNSTNDTTGSTTAAATTMGMTETSRNADEATENSTGVIDGMIDDVERGVDDMTGESDGHMTTENGMETTSGR